LTAAGRNNAISVIAVADRGSMLDASAVYKMNKLVTGPAGVGVCDIRLPIGENIRAYAKSAGKAVDEMVVAVLDREYNSELIQQIRDTGAATRLLLDGDVAGGIQAARGDSRIDICAGVGGSPEGIVTACGIRALGGFMQGILTPREDFERERGAAAGLKFDYVYEMNDMVSSDNTFFVATGVTDGALLSGVKKKDDMIFTESIVIRGRSGTVRKVFAEYQASRWI
jgi:fructose-1,6-bisphosphatase II